MSAKSNAPVFQMKRKLSAKEIVGNVKTIFLEAYKANSNVKRIDLFSVAGVLKRAKMVDTTYGESTQLIGDFLAVNKITGEMYRSNRMYLPAIVSEELEAAINPENVQNVEFAFNIYIIPDDKSGTGYVYMAEPVVKARESDQMAALAEKIGVKSLPAPSDAPALPAPEKGTAASAKKDDGKGKK